MSLFRHAVHVQCSVSCENDDGTGSESFLFDDRNKSREFKGEMAVLKRCYDDLVPITNTEEAGSVMKWLKAWELLTTVYGELPRDINGRKEEAAERMEEWRRMRRGAENIVTARAA